MTAFVHGGPPRYRHQMRGLQKMITTGGVAGLLFDPGTGKTAVVIDYSCLLALKAPSREARILVIAPIAAVDTWVLQMGLWASPQVSWWAEVLGGSMLEKAEALAARGGQPYKKGLIKPEHRGRIRAGHPRAHHWEKAWMWAASERGPGDTRPPITASEGPDGLGDARPRVVMTIINIDPLQRRDEVGSKNMADVFVDAIKRYAPDYVVIDEAHKIKSAGGNASRLVSRVERFVKRRAILTGTVMPHSPMDVFAQWRFLEPYAFGTIDANGVRQRATMGDFQQNYARMGGFYGKEIKGYHRLDEVQKIMAKNATVARKEECLDLPPTTDVIVPVNLSVAERKAYTELKKTMSTDLASGLTASVESVLVLGMRLRQLTSGHLPTDDHGPVEVVGRSKIDAIISVIEDQLPHEKRIVVFALFSYEIEMLGEIMRKRKTAEVMVIEGGTKLEERTRMRREFGDPTDDRRMVMIAQIKTMSVAVNELVTANHAIFASLSQERDDLIQAKARLDRIGQTRPVTFWIMLAPHTVDEVIWKSHQERTSLEAAMLHHIQQDDLALTAQSIFQKNRNRGASE